mmetsp:Transcript_17615/g.30332  ORF Transcript_17615/g.30332 Transcript_17615/m.30332 type:complete len:142 (-) Transcript_17615:541-966(-)
MDVDDFLDGARYADMVLVEDYLVRGIDPSCANENRNTALHYAAANGHSDVIRVLLAYHALPCAKNDSGNQALHWAALNGHADAAVALLEGGADPMAMNDFGRTPFDEAQQGSHDTICRILEEYARKRAPVDAPDEEDEPER